MHARAPTIVDGAANDRAVPIAAATDAHGRIGRIYNAVGARPSCKFNQRLTGVDDLEIGRTVGGIGDGSAAKIESTTSPIRESLRGEIENHRAGVDNDAAIQAEAIDDVGTDGHVHDLSATQSEVGIAAGR